MKSLLLFLLFIFPAHAALPSIIGNNLIDQTCSQTPFYDLCIWTLITNPHSYDADIRGLAHIMITTIESKATSALHRCNKLLKQRLKPQVREALMYCANRYNAVINADIPQALEGLQSGNYKFAERGSNDAATEAMSCEEEFGGRSPLVDKNMMVHDVSVVAASIVKIIIHG